MSATIILPGYGGSGDAHWQTLWQARDPAMRRFRPASWDAPELGDWVAALDRAVAEPAEPPLLVAHSLACLLVPHWASRAGASRAGASRAARPVRGAFLVAPPDPDGPEFPVAATSFGEVPRGGLPFPALVVASTDDPYAAPDFARRCAAEWGAGFVVAGALGHINSASGLGEWPQGAALLEAFRAGTRRPT